MNQTADRSDAAILMGRIGRLWIEYIKGQLLLSVIIGGLTWVVGAAIGLPGALWLGIVAGLLESVPNIGPLVASLPAIVVALVAGSTVIPVDNWAFALIVTGVYILIQQMTNWLIGPYVLGARLDLPPLAVFVAVVGGAIIGNVVGALLAVPLLATAREVLVYWQRRSRGLPPFPDESLRGTAEEPPGKS